MLLIDGKINAKFNAQSKHLNIRNGVGIKADGNLVFAMSKGEVTLYDFADFFRKAGCKNALYLDGFVSKIYLPAQQLLQEDGTFGVIIGEVRKR